MSLSVSSQIIAQGKEKGAGQSSAENQGQTQGH